MFFSFVINRDVFYSVWCEFLACIKTIRQLLSGYFSLAVVSGLSAGFVYFTGQGLEVGV